MTKTLFVSLSLAASAVTFATVGQAAPVPGFHHPPNIVHPSNDFATHRAGGLMNEWMFRKDWRAPAQSYAAALSFASCVQKFSPAAGSASLMRSAADPRVRPELLRLARRYASCAGEQAMVAPLLLRVAFAEVSLRSSSGGLDIAQPSAGSHLRPSLGVPERIDSFPVAAIARCQVSVAPTLVLDLLRTRPGEAAEEAAVQALFAVTPQCVSRGRGSITPTAARMALVDAAFTSTR